MQEDRYSYSINDPANITDPSGESGCETVEAKPRDKSQQASGDGPSDSGAGTADSDANPPQQAGCGGADTPFGGDSGDDEIGIDGAGFGPSSLMGATGEAIGGITITGPPNPQKQIPSPGSTLLWGLKLVSTTIGWCGDPEAQQLCLIGNFAAEPFVWNAQPQSSQTSQSPQTSRSPQTLTPQQQCLSDFSNSAFGETVQFLSPLSLFPSFNANAAQSQSELAIYGGTKVIITAFAKSDQFSGAVDVYSLSTGTFTSSAAGAASFFEGAEIGAGIVPALAFVVDAAERRGCSELY